MATKQFPQITREHMVIDAVSPRILNERAGRHRMRSVDFNIDNGAGTTIDDVLTLSEFPVTIRRAQIVYTVETTGTVSAGNARVGTAVAGVEVVASTAYGNTASVGTTTAMVLVETRLPADTMLVVRHTGVAATAAGVAYVEVEYDIDE